jgi:muramoyltetrapeptide carboxypeptidase
VEFWNQPDPYTEEQFWRMVTSARRPGRLPNPGGERLRERIGGRARGRLLGGNLSLVVSSLGTPFCPDYRGAILVLEDVGEALHRLDRMFTQLRNAAVFEQIRGLVLGQFFACKPVDPAKPHLRLPEVFDEIFSWLRVPGADGLAYGHSARKLTLPMGIAAELDTTRGTLSVLESAVE